MNASTSGERFPMQASDDRKWCFTEGVMAGLRNRRMSCGLRLAAAGPRRAIVALQVDGKPLATAQLVDWLRERARLGEPLAFCIGGPDGLAPAVDQSACLRWSLSPLTLPHGLARVVVAEALYRAISVIRGQPYHRP